MSDTMTDRQKELVANIQWEDDGEGDEDMDLDSYGPLMEIMKGAEVTAAWIMSTLETPQKEEGMFKIRLSDESSEFVRNRFDRHYTAESRALEFDVFQFLFNNMFAHQGSRQRGRLDRRLKEIMVPRLTTEVSPLHKCPECGTQGSLERSSDDKFACSQCEAEGILEDVVALGSVRMTEQLVSTGEMSLQTTEFIRPEQDADPVEIASHDWVDGEDKEGIDVSVSYSRTIAFQKTTDS